MNEDGLELRNLRCVNCGRIQWSYLRCRFCSSLKTY